MPDIPRPEILIDRATVPQVRIPRHEFLAQKPIELIESRSGTDSNVIDPVDGLRLFHGGREEVGLDDIRHVTKVTAGFTIAINMDGLVSDHGGAFDLILAVEVIEHLDAPRLAAFERVLFECARPKTIVIPTPNREYNVKWPALPAGEFRHRDHRFEWTRAEFQDWAGRVAARFGYAVRFLPVGPEDAIVGSPTQMGVFHHG